MLKFASKGAVVCIFSILPYPCAYRVNRYQLHQEGRTLAPGSSLRRRLDRVVDVAAMCQ